jgi:hypothetical protein
MVSLPAGENEILQTLLYGDARVVPFPNSSTIVELSYTCKAVTLLLGIVVVPGGIVPTPPDGIAPPDGGTAPPDGGTAPGGVVVAPPDGGTAPPPGGVVPPGSVWASAVWM